ncbi:MAG TPA: outer membrane beta-barrel protein [Fimbriimonadaceae bacterium]|nr:outer membrane beta-barrel protein [Fimbriimonadaceae bacterium]
MKWTHALTVAALATSTALACAQNPDPNGTYLGLEAGAYFPTDRTIRNVFGSTLPRFGISFISNNQPNKLKPSLNFAVIGANKDGNRFLAIPVTAGVGQQYGGANSGARPYWRVGAGLAYFDYSIDPTNSGTAIAATKVGFTAVGEVGVLLSERVRLSASYNYFSKQDDFDFSGFDIKVSFLFWKL